MEDRSRKDLEESRAEEAGQYMVTCPPEKSVSTYENTTLVNTHPQLCCLTQKSGHHP